MSSYDWIAAVYDKAVFVAFDTETTGLEEKSDRVVEIGAVKFDKQGIISRYNILINPEMPMPVAASKVNNITDEMLADKNIFKQEIRYFLQFIKNTVLIGHNAPFDIGMINAELKRIDASPLTNKVFDTATFARETIPGLPSYALQKLAVQFGISAIEAHRALDDARVCMEFFHFAVKRFLENNAGMIEYFCSQTNIADYLTTEEIKFEQSEKQQSLF